MKINNLLKIKESKIKFFPLQTRDHAFILYPDLPTAYLLPLLIDKIGFSINQFSFEHVYSTNKFLNRILYNINDYDEDYFIFYLENYYHSSNYALFFLEKVLDKLSE
jgi:hypothetical protein